MAELPNRNDLEELFARKFGKVARRHMREFRKLLGNPADIRKIPVEFWQKMKHESESVFYPLLFLIFDESSLFHGWDTATASLAAYGWAKMRADELSTQWVESTQTRLAKGFDKLTTPEPLDEETVEAAKQSNSFGGSNNPPSKRTGSTNPAPDDDNHYSPTNRISGYFEREPTQEEVDELIEDTFGPKRIEVVAIDETTRARHAGGESAVSETVGLSDLDEWRVEEKANHQPDDRVCPICKPLNRTTRNAWPWRFSAGPPAHFRCRCHIEFGNIDLSDAIGRMLDDPDYKSMSALPRFNLKAWFRQIPDAANWRVYCRENEIPVDDRSAYRTFSQ